MKLAASAAVAGVAGATTIPSVKLNTGAEMPLISLGTWQYDSQTAEDTVNLGLKLGFNHIDTANDYGNQDGVGKALAGKDRSSYFLTTKVPPATYDATKKNLQDDLDQLGLDHVDLMLVHFPPMLNSCSSMQSQWKAMEEFYKAGKAKAIGVSNYCISSLKCLEKTWTVVPAVNQVQYHVGMGTDAEGLKSYCDSKGIKLQAYSPLGDGKSGLIDGPLVTGIGKAHNATGAQVSLRWLVENGIPLSTKSTKQSHLQEDLAIFDFKLTADEKKQLDDATSPAGQPSFRCSSMDVESSASDIPSVTLNNGVKMPLISLGTWQYDSQTAEDTVNLGLKLGFNHIDTANNYHNQDGVGKALAGRDRNSYFLTTKVPASDYATTKQDLQDDLSQLGLDHVDLMLVHFPPQSNDCSSMQSQWKAVEEFYKAGKAKAIGVSNYCISSLKCLEKTWTVVPAVNQVQYHVGMGPDADGLKSYCDSKGIKIQAYSPLGDGKSGLIDGPLVTPIAKAHNVTGAQVSLRWLVEHDIPLSTKSTKQSHLQEDLDVFKFQLTASEKSQLDKATQPAGQPSFMCTSERNSIIV